MHALEVPEHPAGGGIESEQGIGKEIVAEARAAEEVGDGGAGGDEDDSAVFIERHAAPVVGGAGGLPGVLWPAFVAGFAGVGDGSETPAEGSGTDIEGADVAGWRGRRLGVAAADDDEVFEDDAGAGEDDGLLFEVTAEPFAEVDAAVFAEARDGPAGGGIEGVEEVHDAGEQAAIAAVGPEGEAACGLLAG